MFNTNLMPEDAQQQQFNGEQVGVAPNLQSQMAQQQAAMANAQQNPAPTSYLHNLGKQLMQMQASKAQQAQQAQQGQMQPTSANPYSPGGSGNPYAIASNAPGQPGIFQSLGDALKKNPAGGAT